MFLEKTNYFKNNSKIDTKENFLYVNKTKIREKKNNIHKNLINTATKTKIKKNENVDPLKILFVTESKKIKEGNLKNILANELLKTDLFFRANYFAHHNLIPEIRTRMVDWMIEVLSSFNCCQNTFFLSLDILDTYLTKTTRVFDNKDIHLLGVTAMLLASKMEEIIPFKVNTIVEKMTHGKMNGKDILALEFDMIQTLNFQLLSQPSLYIFIEFLIMKLDLDEFLFFEDVRKVVTYISKMLMHSYEILIAFPMKYLASSCLYISLKIIEQVNGRVQARNLMEKLKSLLNLEENIFYRSSEILLSLAKNFENEFSFSKNLLKFDAFSLEKN